MFGRVGAFYIFLMIVQCYGEFVIPEVTIEAYEPKGFQASIPAIKGIQLFAFHANLNREIEQVDPGEFNQDFTRPTNDIIWSYFNPNVSLKVGDVINYWIFIQYEKLGYRKDDLTTNITELLKLNYANCQTGSTVVAGKSVVCKGTVIFEDNFREPTIDRKKWKVEHYIPVNSLDYEFVWYGIQRCFIKDRKLFIKPIYEEAETDVLGTLDIRDSCTRQNNEECYYTQDNVFIIPPVRSGQISSTLNFRYAKVEIKAKLPAGDWIYPQMYLEPINQGKPKKKLWIAYARGNDDLLASNGYNIGGRLLFGGPIVNPEESFRSQYLTSKRNADPYTNETHVYTIIWKPDQITLQVDGVQYGQIGDIRFGEGDMVRLVLGVGVGGVNDFPDDFKSGPNAKPWRNRQRSQVKNFFKARDVWKKTWTADRSAFQIEYVKISAL